MTSENNATINPIQGLLKPMLLSIGLTIVLSTIGSVGFAFALAAFSRIR